MVWLRCPISSNWTAKNLLLGPRCFTDLPWTATYVYREWPNYTIKKKLFLSFIFFIFLSFNFFFKYYAVNYFYAFLKGFSIYAGLPTQFWVFDLRDRVYREVGLFGQNKKKFNFLL